MHKLLQIIPVIWNKVVKMKSIKINKGDIGKLERIASQGPLAETGWATSILDTLGKVLHLLVHKWKKKKTFSEHPSTSQRINSQAEGISWDLFLCFWYKIIIKLIHRNRLWINNMKQRKMMTHLWHKVGIIIKNQFSWTERA